MRPLLPYVPPLLFAALLSTACTVERAGRASSDLGGVPFDAPAADGGDAGETDANTRDFGRPDLGPLDFGGMPCNADACPGRTCSSITTCGYARSCAALRDAGRAVSEVYTLEASDGTTHYEAYCELTVAGGGWTLAAKVDGRLSTFDYTSTLWTSGTLLDASPDTSEVEAKLRSFIDLPFTEIRLVFRTSGLDREAVLPLAATSLRSLFSATYVPTSVGRAAWMNLVPGARLQAHCNREGANATPSPPNAMSAAVRLGIIANENAVGDCATPDSFVGVGGRFRAGSGWPAAGNYATANGPPPTGDANIPSFVYIYVR